MRPWAGVAAAERLLSGPEGKRAGPFRRTRERPRRSSYRRAQLLKERGDSIVLCHCLKIIPVEFSLSCETHGLSVESLRPFSMRSHQLSDDERLHRAQQDRAIRSFDPLGADTRSVAGSEIPNLD